MLQGVTHGGNEQRLGSGYVLEVELTELADRLCDLFVGKMLSRKQMFCFICRSGC